MAKDQPPSEPGEATVMLRASAAGDAVQAQRVFELLYAELRQLAENSMRGERQDHTLQPTALVHEVWLKAFEPTGAAFADRRHFLAVSARAMRQVLVDHARTRGRAKRGGRWERVAIEQAEAADDAAAGATDLLALDDALERLKATSPRAAEVVELRYFGGLSPAEAADALELSESTVAREWRFARAWLTKELDSE